MLGGPGNHAGTPFSSGWLGLGHPKTSEWEPGPGAWLRQQQTLLGQRPAGAVSPDPQEAAKLGPGHRVVHASQAGAQEAGAVQMKD